MKFRIIRIFVSLFCVFWYFYGQGEVFFAFENVHLDALFVINLSAKSGVYGGYRDEEWSVVVVIFDFASGTTNNYTI